MYNLTERRKKIYLAHKEGKSMQEIAEMFNIPKQRVSQIIQKIKENVDKGILYSLSCDK